MITFLLGAIHLRHPLVVGDGVIDFKMFCNGEEGVPLVYDVPNENLNCNRKEAKEMERKKENLKTI